jgi:hypothetical protein
MQASEAEATAEAKEMAPAWEVERVLACDSHLEVLRLDRNPSKEEIKVCFVNQRSQQDEIK